MNIMLSVSSLLSLSIANSSLLILEVTLYFGLEFTDESFHYSYHYYQLLVTSPILEKNHGHTRNVFLINQYYSISLFFSFLHT